MIFRTVFAVLALAFSTAASAQSYLCAFDGIYGLNETESGVSANPIQFGQKENPAWEFELIKTEREVEIVWSASPLQFEGKTAALQTGPKSFAIFLAAEGPCMFTEGHCGASLHYAEQEDGSLAFHYQPIALTRFEDGRREPLKVYAVGRCYPEEGGK